MMMTTTDGMVRGRRKGRTVTRKTVLKPKITQGQHRVQVYTPRFAGPLPWELLHGVDTWDWPLERKLSYLETQVANAPVCKECGAKCQWVPPGTSVTGHRYSGFWGCPNYTEHA